MIFKFMDHKEFNDWLTKTKRKFQLFYNYKLLEKIKNHEHNKFRTIII